MKNAEAILLKVTVKRSRVKYRKQIHIYLHKTLRGHKVKRLVKKLLKRHMASNEQISKYKNPSRSNLESV